MNRILARWPGRAGDGPGAGRARAVVRDPGEGATPGAPPSSGLRAPDSTGFGPLGPLLVPLMAGDGDAAGVLMLIEGEPLDMGMPLMLLIGDGDAAAIPMPPMPCRSASRTWSG